MKKFFNFLLLCVLVLGLTNCSKESIWDILGGGDDTDDSNGGNSSITGPTVTNPFRDLDFIEFSCVGDPTDGRVHFAFVVENKDYDLRYYFGYATAYTDEYETHEAGYVGWVDLPKNTPVRVSYSGNYCHFSRVSDTAKEFKTIKIYVQPEGGKSEELKFNNIPIDWQ